MTIKRQAYQYLSSWKQNQKRKPLLVRGARQVGKTTLVKTFAAEFTTYIELNLERESDKALFEIDDINDLMNAIYLQKKISADPLSTLLFIDEIQESPKALQQLRYLHEEKPELYIIAAGSLLEFALKSVPSFPVGRVDYLYLYPLNFIEYLGAIKHEQALNVFATLPVPEYAHTTLLNLFHDYALIGGMPEIVNNYIENKDIVGLSKGYKKLWQSYKDDVAKYGKNDTDKKIIRHVIETAPQETDRIKFEGFGNSNYRSREVGEALRSVDLARVIQLVYPSTSLSPPLIADFKKRPRLQFLDTGMLNNILGLQADMIAVDDLSDFYCGKIIQHLVCQELISIHDEVAFNPHFWVRENKDSNAEVDLIYAYGKYIIPIEVKSGKQGTLKSLHQFINRCDHKYAIRLFGGKFSVEEHKTPGEEKPYLLLNLPYYLGVKLPEYIKWFVENN